jgi:hypothetical protein
MIVSKTVNGIVNRVVSGDVEAGPILPPIIGIPFSSSPSTFYILPTNPGCKERIGWWFCVVVGVCVHV